jgi:hypothetical protein
MKQTHFSFGNIIGTLVLLALSIGVFMIAWSIVDEELVFLSNSEIVEGEIVDKVFVKGSETGPKSSRSGGGFYPITDPNVISSDIKGLKTFNFARLSQRRPFSEGFDLKKENSNISTNLSTKNPLVGFERINDADEVFELSKRPR